MIIVYVLSTKCNTYVIEKYTFYSVYINIYSNTVYGYEFSLKQYLQ